MTAHKHGGWHKPQGAWERRQRPKRIEAITITTPPKESWWTKPVQSREEFDRAAAARSREAGWTGASSQEPTS